jgi:hypothetical protein
MPIQFIQTSSTVKNIFKYKVARYLGTMNPACYSPLLDFIYLMLGDKKIKEEITKEMPNLDDVLKKIQGLSPIMNELKLLEITLKELKNIKKDDLTPIVEKKIKEISFACVLIQPDIHKIFYHIINITDLKNVPIPSEIILQPDKYKLGQHKLRTDMRRTDYGQPVFDTGEKT